MPRRPLTSATATRTCCCCPRGCRATATAPGTAPATRAGSRRPPKAERGLLARLAEALAARGVASLRVDPRGCGASEGAWESTALFTKIDDARDMLSAMRGHPQLDLRRTGDRRPRRGRRARAGRGHRGSGHLRADPDRSSRPLVARRAAPRRERTQPDGDGPAASDRRGARPLERGDHRARRAARGAPRPAHPRCRQRDAWPWRASSRRSTPRRWRWPRCCIGPWRWSTARTTLGDPDESACWRRRWPRAAPRCRDGSCSEPATTWRRRPTRSSARWRPTWPRGSGPVELPPVLLAIEEMGLR